MDTLNLFEHLLTHLLLHVAMEAEEVDWRLVLCHGAGFATQDSGEEGDQELHHLTAGHEDDELLILLKLTKVKREGKILPLNSCISAESIEEQNLP